MKYVGVTCQRRGRGDAQGTHSSPRSRLQHPLRNRTHHAQEQLLRWLWDGRSVTNRDGGPCAHSHPSRARLKTTHWNPGNGNTHQNLRIGSASPLRSHRGRDKRRGVGFYGKRSFSQERLGLARCVRLLCTAHHAGYVRTGRSWQPAWGPAAPWSLHTGN